MVSSSTSSSEHRDASRITRADGRGEDFGLLTCMTPVWGVASRVTAFSTTRLGGISQAPYDALNLGLHVGDDEPAVRENRRRLQESFALPESPHWMKQTHGTDVYAIESGSIDEAICADGSWTNKPDTVLAVLTADCLPVVICDKLGTELAVVHAGWRGLAAGILENALARFSEQAELHAWLGPAIGPDAFEVGAEVRQAFIERNPAHETCFEAGMSAVGSGSPDKQKYWADLYSLARAELQQSRSVTVTGGDYCTVTQPQWFHSHRRDGLRSGRMATVAWIGALPE
ncbi:peptidoglycan editing factor PgeF [Granulosicoccus antarcticus]|uniref:Purine nucleoside phosphorylase n=1 Tax=Granulosicoccus antarcticus IMCC3135 TaxID=1192854 RepID=A0A2Z2P386_9GAMM|nr:peptidoglycan editing factor PgeF [Granulosicoccus antarcticus]ASJ75860.1 Laccase domain protein YfiH [Granulosicoccus antarcticus IMCC3135]